MKKLSRLLMLTVFAGLVLSTVSAKAELLSLLISEQGTIQVGDKIFDEFSYLKTGDMPDPSKVNVVPYIDPISGDFGLKFQGAFLDFVGGGGSDALVGFKVTATGNHVIDGATLRGNAAVLGGAGAMTITETFLPENAAAILNVFSIVPGQTKLVDTTTFQQGYKSLHVQKDILAFSANGNDVPGGIPTLSFFTQTFHQRVVPEPTTVALFGMGLIGLVAVRLRRQR